MIASEQFAQRHRLGPKKLVRQRSLPLPTVVLLLLNLCKNSLQVELDGFFKNLGRLVVSVRTVTKGAFSKARYKLKESAFVEVNQFIVDRFYRNKRYQKWNGYRLLAVDGSTARVPANDACKKFFGGMQPKQGAFRPLARISQLYDVLNGLTVHARMAPYATAERDLAVQHLERCHNNDLLLFDRGYPAFWLFSLLLSKGVAFCARTAVNFCPEVVAFLQSHGRDAYITLSPGGNACRKARKRGVATLPLRLRLVRVDLPTGEVEVLLTSLLDRKRFPRACFLQLYGLRWGVEERYKAIKSRVQIENYSGIYPQAVLQDFYAKIATTNLTSIFAWHAQKITDKLTAARRYKYKINFTVALSNMKDAVVHLLGAGRDTLKHVAALLTIISETSEAIRPGRRYSRRTGPRIQGYHLAYKPTR